MQSAHLASAHLNRLDALRARHAALSDKIDSEQSRAAFSEWYVRDLKKQKLRLKEEIEDLKDVS